MVRVRPACWPNDGARPALAGRAYYLFFFVRSPSAAVHVAAAAAAVAGENITLPWVGAHEIHTLSM